MTARLKLAEQKWASNSLASTRKWVNMVKNARSKQEYTNSMAKFLGLTPATVAKSIPVKNFGEFQKNAEKFLPDLEDGLKSAIKAHSWSSGMKAAFSAPGTTGPRRIIRRGRRRRAKIPRPGKKRPGKSTAKTKRVKRRKSKTTRKSRKSTAKKTRKSTRRKTTRKSTARKSTARKTRRTRRRKK